MKKMNEMSLKMKAVVTVISIATVIFGLILNAVAITFSWAWFISPLGVPKIGYMHALGIGVLVSYMTYPMIVKTEEKSDWEKIFVIVFRPMIYLSFAYLIKCFM